MTSPPRCCGNTAGPSAAFMAYLAVLCRSAREPRSRSDAQRPRRTRATRSIYLLEFITLGFWTVALGRIFYRLIAFWLPDPSQPALYRVASRRHAWQIAADIVALPAFVYVLR